MKKKIYNTLIALQKRLRPLTPAQQAFAHSHYSSVAYVSPRGYVWCQNCGRYEKEAKEIIAIDEECGRLCSCGKRVEIARQIVGKVVNERYYITYGTAVGEWQCFRTFLAKRTNVRGERTAYDLTEVYQNWIDASGKEYILSRRYHRSPLTGVDWDYYSELNKVSSHNAISTGYYYSPDMFDTYGNYVYPRSSMTKTLRRNGFRNGFQDPADAARLLLAGKPIYETIAKTQPYLFNHILGHDVVDIEHYFPAIKICNRNAYTIAEPDMWLDYIDNLLTLGLDIRNARYVCPDDVGQAHEEMSQRVMRKARKEEDQRKRDSIREQEAAYAAKIAPFKGIILQNENLRITPLLSVAEFYEEGKQMHHCVFANEYHKKEDSLVLSARNLINERIATIEYSLSKHKVLQVRGPHNQTPPMYNEISNLINNNIEKQLCKQRKFSSPAR